MARGAYAVGSGGGLQVGIQGLGWVRERSIYFKGRRHLRRLLLLLLLLFYCQIWDIFYR